MSQNIEAFEAWDPLDATSGADPGLIVSAQKREIANILRSYTGFYDVFSELLQNALDAVEKRQVESVADFQGRIWVVINLQDNSIEVTDNGCGMSLEQLRQFLRPNFSFKKGADSRGSKGVGATYLGYGFNSLRMSSTQNGKTYSGHIENGRMWVDDSSGTVARPKIMSSSLNGNIFPTLDRGTSIGILLKGDNVRPRNLAWYQATMAKQWLALLRIMTPIGGIYTDGSSPPKISVKMVVYDQTGTETVDEISEPTYFYPHLLAPRSGSMVEFLKFQEKQIATGADPAKVPAKFQKLNGIWGQWSTQELLGEVQGYCPIQPRLDNVERDLAKDSGISIYVYLAFSTDLWDTINDTTLSLRKGLRVLHGGLQLATRHMPQGVTLTIPMTNNIGFQNLAHVIVHFDQAEPDLGRKGFQPEYAHLAEKLSVSAVTAFRRRYNLLRKPGGAKIFSDELEIEQWIKNQEKHETDHALTIKGTGLFMPTEELPIRSEPLVEQDVVALFNQMLSSGLVRGIQLISSSQYNQYDGLYRVRMDPPFDKFFRSAENPLGIDQEIFTKNEPYITKVKILEYKYNLDGLIEELQSEVKNVNDIGLVIVWEMGLKWREMFDVTCLLDPDTTHHRQIHGTTHSFIHSVSGLHAFEAIVLHDLVRYLDDPTEEVLRQKILLSSD